MTLSDTNESKINELVSDHNISRNEAISLLKQTNNNLEEAVSLFYQKNHKDEMYVGNGQAVHKPPKTNQLVFYADGILINNNFKEMTEERKENLKKMMSQGSFDASLLEGKINTEQSFNVQYEETEFFVKEQKKEINFDEIQSLKTRNIPNYISMDKSNEALVLKIFFQSKLRTFYVNEKLKVGDLLVFMRKYTKENLQFKSDRKEIGNEQFLYRFIGKENVLE